MDSPQRPARYLAVAALVATVGWAAQAAAANDAEADRWVLGAGDPSPLGWVAVGLYLVAAVVLHRSTGPVHAGFIRLTSRLMVVLCANKALDLQSAPADWARRVAVDHGWYGTRVAIQLGFIAVGMLFTVGALRTLPRRLGDRWPVHRTSAVAIVALVAFILIRASSLHQLSFLLSEFWGLRVGTGVEIGLLLVIIAGARSSASAGPTRA